MGNDDCCGSRTLVKRTISPALAVMRTNVYDVPLYFFRNRQKTVDYKCLMTKSISERRTTSHQISVKSGIISSDDPVSRAVQTVGGTLIPGNMSRIRRPFRSTIGSAVATGPRGLIPSTISRLSPGMTPKPDRGFRCPEGFQFGGQFTDKYYSTCGKKLFQLALTVGANFDRYIKLSSAGALRKFRINGFELSPISRERQISASDQISTIRDPQMDIPEVGSYNVSKFREALQSVVKDMTDNGESLSRLVRRDGLVLEPLVSAKVLRTVPDNKSMEESAYVTFAKNPAYIGGDEMWMFSNSGVNSLVYVLPNGGTLTLRKKRNLSNGERRKLGRTISDARKMTLSDNPAIRLEHVSSEMDGPIAYEQNFSDIDFPNDMVIVSDAKTKKQRQVRKWHRDAYLLDPKKRVISERSTQIEDVAGMQDDLGEAVSMLNDGGQIGNISPEIRIPAMERSRVFRARRAGDRATEYYNGRQKLVAMSSRVEFEHIGAMTTAEIQSQLGAVAPYVWFAGSGIRRPYIYSMPDGDKNATRTSRVSDESFANAEDMTRLMIADILTDSLSRNPSLIYTSQFDGKNRTYSAPLSLSAMSGMNRKEKEKRISETSEEVMRDLQTSIYSDYFRSLRAAQRKRALSLLEELLERAKMFSFADFARRMAIDGKMSEAERIHLESVKRLYEKRVQHLYSGIKTIRETIGE